MLEKESLLHFRGTFRAFVGVHRRMLKNMAAAIPSAASAKATAIYTVVLDFLPWPVTFDNSLRQAALAAESHESAGRGVT